MTLVRGKEKAMIEKKHKYHKDFKKPDEKIAETSDESVTEESASPKKSKKLQKKVKTRTKLNIRKSPEVADNVIGSLSNGTVVSIESEKNGWSKIAEGYVMSKYLEDIK